MHFLINNLAPSDLADRVELIRKAVFPEFKDWFANYLVVKRAAQVCALLLHPAPSPAVPLASRNLAGNPRQCTVQAVAGCSGSEGVMP